MGFSPKECYYKVIKMEEKIKVSESIFGERKEWIEVQQLNKKD
jgi:hypothetical protein